MTTKRKTVLLQGTFHLLNWGHVKAFELCKSFGDYFIVALNTDELVRDFKKREPLMPWYQMKEIIESIKWVDEVVEAPNFSPMELLKKYDVDVYVLTEEWRETKAEEIAYMLAKGGEVKFSPRFEGVVCTTDIRKQLLKEAQATDRKARYDEFMASRAVPDGGVPIHAPNGGRKFTWD